MKAQRNRPNRVRDEHLRNVTTATLTGKIVSVSPDTETMLVDIGASQIEVAHPFVSGESWIRTMPSTGTLCTLSYDQSTKRYKFVAYASSQMFTTSMLDAYKQKRSLYRVLKEGEIELTSKGGVDIYMGDRPYFGGRAGAVSWSYDSDKLEASATAPTHVMRGHNNSWDRIGNEIRFGAVKRPLSYATELYAYTMPDSNPVLDKYTYAYEYLMSLSNDNSAPLVDVRVGEVYEDSLTPGIPFAKPALSKSSSLPLRARYRFFNTIEPGGLKAPGMETDIEISCLGDIDVLLSQLATHGFSLGVPSGDINTKAGLATSIVSRLAVLIKSEVDKIKMNAAKNIELVTQAALKQTATSDVTIKSVSSDMNLNADTGTVKIGAVTIQVSGTGLVSIHGALGLTLTGALGETGRPIATQANCFVTNLPFFIDPTLKS